MSAPRSQKEAPRVIAVVGPTASGKSALALRLAEELGGEILNYDSVQVYKHFDIGTAKPGPEERSRLPHHLIDIVEPTEDFSAARFAELADEAARQIAARGHVVVACGGTGLYLRAWLRGLFPAPPKSPAIRARHREEGLERLRERLMAVDPEAAAAIAPRDFVRISRALEVYEQTGTPISELWRRAGQGLRYPVRLVGLCPPRDVLYERINARFDAMMEAGLVAEVERLLERYGPNVRPMGALGYAEIRDYLMGRIPLDEAVRRAKRKTRHYARRQLT